jgi:hypothetical protein
MKFFAIISLFLLLIDTPSRALDVPKSSENQGLTKVERLEKIETDVIRLVEELNKKEKKDTQDKEAFRQEIIDEVMKKVEKKWQDEWQPSIKKSFQEEITKTIKQELKKHQDDDH